MNRDDSSSMSSFEHVELTEPEPPNPNKSVPQQPAAAVDVTAAAGTTAGRPPAHTTTPPAPPASTDKAPLLDAVAADAPSTSPTAQAAGALQSVLGFLGGGTVASDSEGGVTAGEVDAEDAHIAEPASPLADPVAEFEKEALDAALKAEEAVKEVGQKLLHGAAEAREGLSSLAHGFSSWWSTLDPAIREGGASSAPSAGGAAGAAASGQRATQDVQQAAVEESLGLEGGETVLESFSCQLLQTYISSANFFTPARQVPFPGRLHITSQRLCFVFEEKAVAPIKLDGKAMKAVAKQAAGEQKGDAAGLPERLEVQLEQAGQALVLSHFALGEAELDSALALVEHLVEGEA